MTKAKWPSWWDETVKQSNVKEKKIADVWLKYNAQNFLFQTHQFASEIVIDLWLVIFGKFSCNFSSVLQWNQNLSENFAFFFYINTVWTSAAIAEISHFILKEQLKRNANKSAQRLDIRTTILPIFLWSVSPQLTQNDCDSSLWNHWTQWHSIKYILKIKILVKGAQLWLAGQHVTGWLETALLTLLWHYFEQENHLNNYIQAPLPISINKVILEGCCTLTVKPWEEPHIRQPVSVPLKALVSVSNQWLFSVSRPLSHNLSILRTCEWLLRNWVWLFLLLLAWEEGRCVYEGKRERDKTLPFLLCSLPLLPSGQRLLLGECLSVCVCVCVCHFLALGPEAFSRGVRWLSHSYVRIRRIHLHFLTATHSIFRLTYVMFSRMQHRGVEVILVLVSFQVLFLMLV